MASYNLSFGGDFIELEKNQENNHEISKEKHSKEIYFIVLYERKQIEKNINDFTFVKNHYKIDNIYTNILKKNQSQYFYQKVFKVILEEDDIKKENNFDISFEIGGYTYTIAFNIDDKSFYYDIIVTKIIKLLSIFPKKEIDQSFLNYYQKLELFISALKQNKEEGKIDNLYEIR